MDNINNKDITNIIEEINSTDNIVIHILRDMVEDYKRICKKLIFAITILSILSMLLITYFIFSFL